MTTEATFDRVMLEDPTGQWELHRGRLREKPAMGSEHNDLMAYLGHLLLLRLSRSEFRIRVNSGHLQRRGPNYFIPDVAVLPVVVERRMRGRPGRYEVYPDPLPLVVEVWSPSTGEYDVESKVPEYQARGDAEIWRLHPFDRTLTVWRRQADGSYVETSHRGGRGRDRLAAGVLGGFGRVVRGVNRRSDGPSPASRQRKVGASDDGQAEGMREAPWTTRTRRGGRWRGWPRPSR